MTHARTSAGASLPAGLMLWTSKVNLLVAESDTMRRIARGVAEAEK